MLNGRNEGKGRRMKDESRPGGGWLIGLAAKRREQPAKKDGRRGNQERGTGDEHPWSSSCRSPQAAVDTVTVAFPDRFCDASKAITVSSVLSPQPNHSTVKPGASPIGLPSSSRMGLPSSSRTSTVALPLSPKT